MSLTAYISSLRTHLQMGRLERAGVMRELSTHLEDRTVELMDRGLSREEAATEAVRRFGDPQTIASEISSVHNQGTWQEVGLSALPHVLIAALFASHRWLELEWLGVSLFIAAAVSVFGWVRGRPLWTYPWLGYALFPFLLVGTVSLATLGQATWSILTQGYMPTSPVSWVIGLSLGILGVVVVCYLLVWVSKRDWLHASLLILPVPLLSISLLTFDRGTYVRLDEADSQTGILFLFVAFAVAVIVRLKDRSLKLGVLAASLPVSFLLISGALDADVRTILAILLSLPAVMLVLSPLLFSLDTPDESE